MASRYKVGDYKFSSKKEYQAALNDMMKICALKTEGGDLYEIYDSYLAQIAEKSIVFESCVGKDFLKQINERRDLKEADKSSDAAQNVRAYYVVSKKKQRVKWFLMTTFILLFVICAVILCGFIIREYQSREKLERIRGSVREEEDAMVVVDDAADSDQETDAPAGGSGEEEREPVNKDILPRFEELHEQNEDFAGWLTIPDTRIDYPVMYRADDNNFYLGHDFDREVDVNGLLVLDKRCDPQYYEMNYLIHGHNMRSGAMFGGLKNYAKESYYKKHPEIEFSTLYEERTFQIFAVFRSSVYDETTDDFRFYDYIRIDDEKQFDDYVSGAKEQSLYDTGITPAYGDILITLSTCDYSKENGRLVVVGRCEDE